MAVFTTDSKGEPLDDIESQKWYHGSPFLLKTLSAGSSITRNRNLAIAFSHKPTRLEVLNDGTIIHNGKQRGYLYEIDEPVAREDICPHPTVERTTPDDLWEWLTKREFRLKLIRETTSELRDQMTDDPLSWPILDAESRPWTRWWWFGADVTKHGLTELLETYRDASIGGVEVTSIYGVKGREEHQIPYLSPEWLEMLRHTISEASRLGMSVDMPPGSGWRTGGPFVPKELGGARLIVEPRELQAGSDLRIKVDGSILLAARAVSSSGDSVDLRDQIRGDELIWRVPDGEWKLYIAESRLTGERVKRPGIGGEGFDINPFSRRSFQLVIDYFTPRIRDLNIRCLFHDSWEYGSDACPELFDEFRRRHGYDPSDYLPEIAGEGDPDTIARIRHDLRETLSELAYDNFIKPWSDWCHSLGMLFRNQAHGTPGNLLDFYAVADIPETEVFRQPTEDTPLISKFASSAGHVAGRRLISSETCTWLGEHYTVTLAKARELIDGLLVAGINHCIYHGTAYSPADIEFPGWVFYASTQLNPHNPIWRDFKALNDYVARCQSIMQSGEPDNDLLLYFPVHDIYQDVGGSLLKKLTIEGTWFFSHPIADIARKLWREGYGFDYVSDKQLQGATVTTEGRIKTPGASYRAVVIPPCEFMPVETLTAISRMADAGARVVFVDRLPSDVPGLADLGRKRAEFRGIIGGLTGRLVSSEGLHNALRELGIDRESVADCPGVTVIRRRYPDGYCYFIANHGDLEVDGWIEFAVPCSDAVIMDPMTGRTGLAAVAEADKNDHSLIYLQIHPGASILLKTANEAIVDGRKWEYEKPSGDPVELSGRWRVEFIDGGPVLPESYETDSLESWAERGGDYERFAGTARYTIAFNLESSADRYLLDLGEVHASARVRLNGKDVGTVIGPNTIIKLEKCRQGKNTLEMEITSTAANRIRDMDIRGINWKIFQDINIVNINYKPFDASNWHRTPCGLIGPVTLIPVEGFTPELD